MVSRETKSTEWKVNLSFMVVVQQQLQVVALLVVAAFLEVAAVVVTVVGVVVLMVLVLLKLHPRHHAMLGLAMQAADRGESWSSMLRLAAVLW